MSKAKFKCYSSRLGPNADRYQRGEVADHEARAERLRTIAARLKGSGRNCAEPIPTIQRNGEQAA